jgi:hypothetical protein
VTVVDRLRVTRRLIAGESVRLVDSVRTNASCLLRTALVVSVVEITLRACATRVGAHVTAVLRVRRKALLESSVGDHVRVVARVADTERRMDGA